jgi:hypothetical protein
LIGAAMFVPGLQEAGVWGRVPVLAALAAVIGLIFAARAASPDAPHARSAALAAATGAPFGLAFVGAAVAAALAQTGPAARAVAMVAPADKLTIAMAAVEETKGLALLSTWGWALAAVPVLAAGGWAVMRGSALKAHAGALASSAMVVGLVAAADLSAARAVNDAAQAATPAPWDASFRPVNMVAYSLGEWPQAALGPDGWSAERISEVISKSNGRSLIIALDERVTGEQVRQLLEACQKQRIGVLTIAGARAGGLPVPRSTPYDPIAWLPKLLDGPVGVEIFIEDRPDEDGKIEELALEDVTALTGLVSVAAGVQRDGRTLALKRSEAAPAEPEAPQGQQAQEQEQTVGSGGLDKEVIRRVIVKNVNQFRFCYERELQKRPALQGKVSVSFTIEASGAVKAATAEEDLGDPAVAKCIVERFKKLRFPKPLGGGIVKVTYPFVFKPAE